MDALVALHGRPDDAHHLPPGTVAARADRVMELQPPAYQR